MESTDSPSNKKITLEELSKDELIKKCNNFLMIAKKAKQAKDDSANDIIQTVPLKKIELNKIDKESSEELKKYKENEMKLSSDVAALKEVVESFNKKQTEFAEVQNKHKITEEKNSELKRNFKELEEKYAQKITECSHLSETLKKLSDKICILEISNSEYIEKLSYFKENYAQLDIENKMNLNRLKEYQQNEIELRKKIQLTEEKYIKLEITLKEFQGKYLEECKNHEELQETLMKLQNRSSSGRCSSRSSDSLKPVYENQEYDEMSEKYNELMEKNKLNILEIERLNKKLNENENLVKEWSMKYNKVLENQNKFSNERFAGEDAESEKLKGVIRDKQLECDRLMSELNEKNKLLIAQDDVIKENNVLKLKIENLKISLDESMSQYKKTELELDQCQNALSLVKKELEQEKKQSSEKINEYKDLVNEKNEILSQKLLENENLTERLLKHENNLANFKVMLNEIIRKYGILLDEETTNQTSLLDPIQTEEKCLPKLESLSVIKEQEERIFKEINQNLDENEPLLKQLKEIENILLKIKKNYESAVLEKNKLIEIYESDKSAEEIFKKNITELKQELTMLRNENETADIKYKEMEQKLEESRIISELLKKEIDGKCDEYDAFKKEMEFYKTKNDELNKEISTKDADYAFCKEEFEKLKKAEKEYMNTIETLKENLKSAKIFEEKCVKLEEDLKQKKPQNERESYIFEDFSFECGEKYKCILNKYIKDGNVVESFSLVKDLFEISEEMEKLHGNVEKENKNTEVDGVSLEGGNHFSKVEILSDRIKSFDCAVRDIKNLKMQINKEVLDSFSSLRMDNAKIIQDINRCIGNVYHNLQHGNSELLTEMNDMNQVLKERGWLISKLEKVNESQREELGVANAKISQLDAKLSEKKNSMKKMFEELEEAKQEIENKDKIVKDMEEEIWKLRNSDSHGETLSSSTISKVEEAARLMDVEESFEERYSKLKVIAAKLKKKVSEQQKQLEEERSKSASKNNELQTKITNFQTQIKSLMNIQAEYDRLQDLYEGEKTEKSMLRKVLESANEKIDSLKQEVEDIKKEKDKLLNDKSGFDNIKKKLSAQIITLKASVEEEKNKQIKLEKELEKVDYERSLKEKKLEEEKEKHKGTRTLLEKQKMEAKNLGVLKLEIAEYEKSVGDLEKKLAIREEEANELNCLLENQKSQCKLYLDEITRLKSQLTEENERATEANIQMKKFNEESSTREVEFKEKLNEIGTLKTAVEDKKKELEEMTLELAKISQDKLKLEEKYKSMQDHSSREIHSLQDIVAGLQDSLNQKELEVGEIKKEFDAYKVRAQSVLRQSQKESNQSKQRNVVEELEQLKSTSESLKARLEESGIKMQKLVEENGVFQEEKNRLCIRIQELKTSLADLRAENQELKESKQKEYENHNEALKLQKLQSETLAHCFQKKIDELQANHKSQMEELTKDYEQLQKRLQSVLNMNEKREHNEHRRSSSNFIPVKSDKEILDVMLLEREECEGSESTDSVSPQTANNTSIIPLDQLLNSSDHLEQSEEKRSPLQDVNRLNDKLEKSENRIKHLTVLLSEAETDCARLQQLNDVLKEEIRRNQRNIEREQHAQNFEYMKNVVLKFISLHNVDEKVRLVPVLNTILKLTPEEENILANAARGILEPSNSNRGWGSYLNIWSGAQ